MNKNTIQRIFFNLKCNVRTALKTLRIHRDKTVWIFGAWMGERFADNSRFLFQYLSESKNKYGISDVVWISRNQSVVDLVNSMGYKAYLVTSKEGEFYHYKAGVHVICNSNELDIDTSKSFGAKKIQLWHGNGIKASGRLTRKNKNKLKDIIWDKVIKVWLIPGNWYYAHWLACSKESKRVLINDSGALHRKVIIANSPRLCYCIKKSENEIQIIDILVKEKDKGKRIALFLPTFRGNDSSYIAPLDIPGFLDYLNEKNILWVQKKHAADKGNKFYSSDTENVINLTSDFDVNVLYDYIDLFISDYSSATTDAIFKNVVTIDYCPDYSYFEKSDRGFVSEYSNYHIGNLVKEPSELISMIDFCLGKTVDDFPKHAEVQHFLFDDNVADYDVIVKNIMRAIE